MEAFVLFCLLSSNVFWFVNGAGSGCQDIDHDACVQMAKQNSNICSDQILSRSACPKYCNKCPVTCYNCNTTTSDVSNCNTVTCTSGEMCLRTTLIDTGISHKYKMSCAGAPICSVIRKRGHVSKDASYLESRGVSVDHHCCDTDLCNSPLQPTSTTSTTSTTRQTTPSSTALPTTMPFIHNTTKSHYCSRDLIIMIEDSIDLLLYYGTIKHTLNEVIKNLDIGLDRTRVALGTFNLHYGIKQWDLDRYSTKESVMSAVSNIQFHHHQSNANNFVAVQFIVNNFSKGNRAHVPDDVIIISEGHALNLYYFKENAAINQLHQMSHNVIAVGLGAVKEREMRWVSTDNNHYFYIENAFSFNYIDFVTNVTNLVRC